MTEDQIVKATQRYIAGLVAERDAYRENYEQAQAALDARDAAHVRQDWHINDEQAREITRLRAILRELQAHIDSKRPYKVLRTLTEQALGQEAEL